MTTRVLLDAVNARATGPLALLLSLVPALLARSDLVCTGLIPEGPLESLDWPHGVTVVPSRAAGWRNRAARVADILWRVAATAERDNACVTLSLGDIGPLFGWRPSLLFLHNALLVGEEDRPVMRATRALFRSSARRASKVIVQSPVMAAALQRSCSVPAGRISVIPHPPPVTPLGTVPSAVLDGAPAFRLLYLAAYYPHKRHDLLVPLANILRERGLASRVRIYVTIGDAPATAALLSSLAAHKDIVVNLGSLTSSEAAASLHAVDGLLHLSDAESYGLTLIEALRAGREIIAPSLPYAKWLCGCAATYFAAGDAFSLADAIGSRLIASLQHDAPDAARETALSKFVGTWDETAMRFAAELRAVTPAPASRDGSPAVTRR